MTKTRPQVRVENHGADVDTLVEALGARDVPAVVGDLGDPSVEDLQGLRAVVLAFAVGRVGEVREVLLKLAGPVLDAGVNLVLMVDRTEATRVLALRGESNIPLPRAKSRGRPVPITSPGFYVESDANVLANLVASLAVPRPSAPVSAGLETDIELLFGRAFSDLTGGVVVVPFEKGKQGKTSVVFRVDGSDSRGQLLPFFAKVTDRSSAAFELDNFRRHVEDFVPFPVRSSIVAERCVFGSKKGLLVQRLIEHEHSLSEIVLDVASPGTLHNVFEHLLAGWWHHGATAQVVHGNHVLAAVKHWYDPDHSPKRATALEEHAKQAKAKEPAALVENIRALSPRPYKAGWIHGDLHAENIRVRGTDAFLIDFGSVDQGPLLADPAALEASLVLKSGIACCEADNGNSWRSYLETCVYAGAWHQRVPERRDLLSNTARLARLGDALRIIRMHAFSIQTSPGEYAQLVAAAFLRQASFASDASDIHRSMCVSDLYKVAAHIVASLT